MNLLNSNGFRAQKGQIIDASIVRTPIQRNTRAENELIKNGEQPEDWDIHKCRQKDIDARWTCKNNKYSYGYKNHISIDVKNKFIRAYRVTSANVHDSNVFEELLDPKNTNKSVWADSAYRSAKIIDSLNEQGYREKIQRKGSKNKKITKREQGGNKTRSRIRSRVEHVFGIQAMKAGNLILRTIGILRSEVKIGLRNLAYNVDRFRCFSLIDC